MNPYLTDSVDIIAVTHDANSVETSAAPVHLSARVSEKNKLLQNVKGMEVMGRLHVILESGTVVTYGDRMKVKAICGVAYSMPDKEWEILQVSNGHGFSAHHIEVWAGEGA